MSNNTIKTAKQQAIASSLNQKFGINEDRILFLNPRDPDDPWIPSDELESIARQTEGCQQISVMHDKFIPETNQIIYTATVVNKNGASFTHPGVATIWEKPNGVDIEPDVLAAGRALGAALRAAGFHPYRSGSVVDIEQVREQIKTKAAEADEDLRLQDLKQIHALAAEKGLIERGNYTAYRMWLYEHFEVKTAVGLNATDRARVINALKTYINEFVTMQQETGSSLMAA